MSFGNNMNEDGGSNEKLKAVLMKQVRESELVDLDQSRRLGGREITR